MGHVNSHRVPSMAARRRQMECDRVQRAWARGVDLSRRKLPRLDGVRGQRLASPELPGHRYWRQNQLADCC